MNMMNVIDNALKPISKYMAFLKRDTESGRYELHIGIPVDWFYKETKKITCEIIGESSEGKLIKIFSELDDVTVDNLVSFAEKIITANNELIEDKKAFDQKLQGIKSELEEQIKEFNDNLEEKRSSFFYDENSEKESNKKKSIKNEVKTDSVSN